MKAYIDLLKAKHRVTVLTLKAEISNLRESLDFTRESLASVHQDRDLLRDDNYELQAANDRLEEEKRQIASNFATLTTQCRELAAKYNALATQLANPVPPPVQCDHASINLAAPLPSGSTDREYW